MTHDHHDHPHTHEPFDSPGEFATREPIDPERNYAARAFTVGIGGPVGSGKTALLQALCERLRGSHSLGVVTNDIFTREDAEFLLRHQVLEQERIIGVETGGCPHAAIREDISLNLNALEELMDRFADELDLLLVESGGDNLASTFSLDLVDYWIFVIDVAGGDDIPRKKGPGIVQADLLIINKIDLAPHVGVNVAEMATDAEMVRGGKPVILANCRDGEGLDDIVARLAHDLLMQE